MWHLGAVLLFTTHTLVLGDPSRAHLELIVNHDVASTVRPNDNITYNIVLKQKPISTLEAVDVHIHIHLPSAVKFVVDTLSGTSGGPTASTGSTEPRYTSVIHDSRHADYELASLAVGQQVQFTFAASIVDGEEKLIPGFHYASTPIQLSYKTRAANGAVSTNPTIVSTVAKIPYFIDGCIGELGVSNNEIEFFRFTASSTQVDLKPDKARNNGVDDGWCADVRDETPFIQVMVNHLSKITGVATWGRNDKSIWVKKYTIEYSVDGTNWYSYGETGLPFHFPGNFDSTSRVRHWLIEPFHANYIRFFPIQWSVGVCMRVELYGCPVNDRHNCMQPLGMESGKIPAASLTSLQQPAAGYAVSTNMSRLNDPPIEFPYGWMADFTSATDHLQIDLGSSYQIRAIAIQGGGGGASNYVTTFQLKYSNNSKNWQTQSHNGGTDIPGSAGGKLADMIYMSPNFNARYLRIIPLDSVNFKVMRLEFYGCLVDDNVEDSEIKQFDQVQVSRRNVFVDEETGFMFACVYTHNRGKSICKRSNDGQVWQALNPTIMGIVYQDRATRRLFGVDRSYHKTVSDDNGITWFSVTNAEWHRKVVDGDMIPGAMISDVFPTLSPDYEHTWTTRNGNKWGVSGTGIHRMGPRDVEWGLIAGWKCCGL